MGILCFGKKRVNMLAKVFVAERGGVPKSFFKKALKENNLSGFFMDNEFKLLDEILKVKPDILFLQVSIVEESKDSIIHQFRIIDKL